MELLSTTLEQKSMITMSSREIAELCEKEHKTVVRDIRVMLIQLYGDDYVSKNIPEQYRNRHSEYIRENAGKILEAITKDGTNWFHQQKGFSWERDNRGYITVFRLDKEHSLTLIAGYNVKLRKRIIDRWQELENQQNPTALLPQNYLEALKALVASEEEKQVLQLTNQQQATQIQAMEDYFNGGMSPVDFARSLNGVNSMAINGYLLKEIHWLREHNGVKRVSGHVRDKYLAESPNPFTDLAGNQRVQYRLILLQKGAAKLFKLYTMGKLPMKKSWNGEYTQDKAVGL